MIKYLIIKQISTSQETLDFEKDKSNIFSYEGEINLENIRESSFKEELNYIQEENQKELNEKGETEFVIYTKTYVSLKNKADLLTAVLQDAKLKA
ncbi:hypothetical protein BWK60_09990 [Flavobacterium covae]|uniref:hypothetical protein n=1 Tax=Flavobacterium covae TaxID=2906076 RepID=UPI000B4DBC9F|nr:hypothetical protein [Flavobacterium covae]OWP86211.1 hypothetical protein BWK60_09990 [Flavobacterium covae]